MIPSFYNIYIRFPFLSIFIFFFSSTTRGAEALSGAREHTKREVQEIPRELSKLNGMDTNKQNFPFKELVLESIEQESKEETFGSHATPNHSLLAGGQKEKSDRYSLMQQNTLTLLFNLKLRMARMIEAIKKKSPKPEIIGLQEVSDIEDQRKKLVKELPQYHFCFSYAPFKSLVYPWITYLPFLAVASLAFFSPAYYITTVIALLLHPALLVRAIAVLGKITDTPFVMHMIQDKTCQVGLAIALDKKRFQKIQIIDSAPFPNPGYQFPSFLSSLPLQRKLMETVRIFGLKACARPGYLLISCWDTKAKRTIYVLNAHFVIGLENKNRLYQAQKLYEIVGRFTKNERTFVFIDANTSDDTEEIQFLLQHGFIDCWKKKYPLQEPAGYTWDNSNPLVKAQSMQDEDTRIDYIFFIKRKREKVDIKKIGLCGKGSVYSDHWGIDAEMIFRQSD